MRDLAVFDLDGTLIPHDSFARLVKANFWRPAIALASGLRFLKRISAADFAEQAHRALIPVLQDSAARGAIAGEIAQAVLPERLARIAEWRKKGAHLVLLSASPADYVEPLAERLGFNSGFGSHWADGRYRHLHGAEKLAFINQRYPAAEWPRAYAIGDSPSDELLLAEFKDAERVGALAKGN